MDARIAFQGGGAKLVLLLAAAEAVQLMESRGKIRITQLTGTSAGAIVAGLLAAERKISDARATLLQKKDVMLKEYELPWLPVALKRMWQGQPFWSDKLLKEWLTAQFESFRHQHLTNNLTFDDFKATRHVETSVVWTNLSTGSAYVASGGHNVVEAILSSAGLPFCFRTWKTNHNEVIVDGGMCKNLPIGPLTRGAPNTDEIIAFTFDRPLPGSIRHVGQFAFSLLDAAITDSVETAQQLLPKDALFVLDASAHHISTFDFPTAFDFLASNAYSDLVNSLVKRLDSLVSRRQKQIRNIKSDLWRNPEVSKMMRSLGKFYQESFVHHRFRYVLMKLQIVAYSLVPKGEEGHGKNDEIKYVFEFEATDHPIEIHRVFLSAPVTVDHIPDYETQVSVANDRPINVEFVGATVAEKPKLRALLALFSPPLVKSDGICRLTFRDYAPDALGGLARDERTDYLRMEVSRAEGNIDRIDVGIFVPDSFTHKIYLGAHNLINPKPMSDYEKGSTFDKPPLGFSCLGWRSENQSGQSDVSVEFKSG